METHVTTELKSLTRGDSWWSTEFESIEEENWINWHSYQH